jgi:hypothetical protein
MNSWDDENLRSGVGRVAKKLYFYHIPMRAVPKFGPLFSFLSLKF